MLPRAGQPQAAATAEEVGLDHEVRDQPDADHAEQRSDRQTAAEQELRGKHRECLSRDFGPAQTREPLNVDPVTLGDGRGGCHARTVACAGFRPALTTAWELRES